MSLLVRLRPTGPWRIGPADGSRDRCGLIYRGDLLYSAVTNAMRYLGMLDAWLLATAANPEGPAVRFSSCFPFIEGLDLVTPPRTVWPPSASTKVRWKGAQFVPVKVVESLLNGQAIQDDAWSVDGPSECLVPNGKAGPFRMAARSGAGVDRLSGAASPHSTGCLEFQAGAGLWCLVSTSEEWMEPVKTAFRWLAESGFGGERSQGWGRSAAPEFSEVAGLLAGSLEGEGTASDYWLLAPYSPAASDEVDWSRGSYSVLTPGGWVENSGSAKKQVRLISEGSVVSSARRLVGAAPNVAPDGFPHPVYRAGFAYAIPLPAVTA